MRTVTRNAVLVILAVVALLLALGALPSLLKSGDPYRVVATSADPPAETVNATNLSERRYRYTTGALAAAASNANDTGRSDPYWRGPFGFKEGFTHSPFDEFEALSRDYPNATETAGDDTRVYLTYNGTSYRVGITQSPASVDGSGDASAQRLAGAPQRLTGAASAATARTEVAG